MKILVTSVAVAMLGTSTFALDLTENFSVDSTVQTWYNTETSGDAFTATLEIKPTYSMGALSVYSDVDLDLEDIQYNGMTLGADYLVPMMPNTTLQTKMGLDEDGNRGDVYVGAEFKF